MSREPVAVIGWIFVMGGVGWIAFALYRHFNPARLALAGSQVPLIGIIAVLVDSTGVLHR
jgi:hypothetical protein